MIFLIFALILSLGVAAFAVQNSLPVVVKFLYWSFETSLVIIILGSASLGAIVIFLLHLFSQLRLRWNLRSANQKIRELEDELKQLKPKPAMAESGDNAASPGEKKDKPRASADCPTEPPGNVGTQS